MNNVGSKLWHVLEDILHFAAENIFRIKFSEGQWEKIHQFIKFGVVGVSNTIISYVIYVSVLLIFKKIGVFLKTDYLVSQIIAFVLSVLWSFYWNNKYVFSLGDGMHRSIVKALLKTYVSYSFTGLFLNSILIMLWVNMLHISEFIAPIINLLISVPLNFFINKYWAFK